jgi:hypothetical protein
MRYPLFHESDSHYEILHFGTKSSSRAFDRDIFSVSEDLFRGIYRLHCLSKIC